MKKLLAVLVLAIALIVSCTKAENADIDGLKIVAVDFPSYDAVRAILGSDKEVSMLLPPGSESHSYEPTAKDMIEISNADLVVFAGGASDEWVHTILDSLDNPVPHFALMDYVDLYEEEYIEGMEHDHEHEEEHDHEHEAFDEHVWTSPINEIKIIKALTEALSDIVPDRKEELIENSNSYIKQLEYLDSEFRALFEKSSIKTMIFASRFPLRYFVEEYGLEYYAAFPGCAEESEPSARTIAFLIDKVRDENLGYVFNIEFGSPMIASVIASESGAEVREFHTVHNLTAIDFANNETYISLMERNLEVLKEVFL